MDDDSLSVGMFIIIYIIFIIYLKYIENLSVVRGDFANFTCNPLYLLADSILDNDAKESTNKFEGCIKKMVSTTIPSTPNCKNGAASSINNKISEKVDRYLF